MVLYMIQVIIYTAIMIIIYRLFAYNSAAFKFSRYYLLSSALFPVLLPFVKLPTKISQQVDNIAFYSLSEFTVSQTPVKDTFQTIAVILLGIYCLGVVIGGVVYLLKYLKLRKLISSNERETKKGYVLIKNSGYGPASWNKYILLPENTVDESIIQHEYAHISMRHTIDINIVTLLQIVFWPNIFLWLIKRELVMVHEFQADEVVEKVTNNYPLLLLASVFGKCTLPYTHSFITHPIKRRIIMLRKTKKYTLLRSALAATSISLVMIAIVSIQSCKPKGWEMQKTQPAIANEAVTFAHKMPEPNYKLVEKLAESIKYPEEAKKKGIEDTVTVKFIVDREGHITNVSAVKDDYNPLLRDAAVNAIKSLPDWHPGEDENGNKVAVWYNIPIRFKLD